MTNKKISALTGSTTPLVGTELVPIVQSSATVNVTIANLTAGRAVATGTLSVTSSSAPAATFQYSAGAGNITKFQSSALSGYVMCDHSGNGNWYFDTASLANFGVKVNSSTIGLFSPAGFAVTGVGSFSETLSAKLTANPGGLPTTSGSSVSIVSLRVANANTGVGIDFGADGAATGDGWIQSRSPSDYTVNNPLRINPNGGLTSIGAGLTVTTGNATISNGNLIPATAAKGINFTANTPAAGMTSQLLNWYEQGTWTPSQGAGLTVVGAFASEGLYVRVGRQVTLTGYVSAATTVSAASGGILCGAMPFTPVTGFVGITTGTVMNLNATASAGLYVNGASIYCTGLAATQYMFFTATFFV